jgi:hypothetical protein
MKTIIALICLISIAYGQLSSMNFPSTTSFSFHAPSEGSQIQTPCLDAAIRLSKWLTNCGTPNYGETFLQNLDTYCASPHTTNCTLAVLDKIGIDLIKYCPMLTVIDVKVILGVIGISRALCFNYSGHYCINYGIKLAALVTDYYNGNITLQNATAQVMKYCDSFCPTALRRIAVRLAPILDIETRVLLTLPSIACWTVKTDYCLFKLMEYLEAAKAANWTGLLHVACHPCMRYLLPLRAILRGTPIDLILAFIPDYRIVCQTYNNVSCLKIVIDAINSSQVLQKCPDHAGCVAALIQFNTSAGCCTRTVFPFLPLATALALEALLHPGPVCEPLGERAKLILKLWLQNVNWTVLQQEWNNLKSTVKSELANMLTVYETDLNDPTLITSGKRQTSYGLSVTVDPSGTAYDANDLNNLANTFMNSMELSSLNQGTPGLTTDPSGVGISGGSSSVEGPSSLSSNHPPSSAGVISISMFFITFITILVLL